MTSLTEYLKSQEELLHEAAIALPHQFSRCAYSLGPLRSLADRSLAWILVTEAISLGKRCIYVSLVQRLGDYVLRARLRATLTMSKSNCMHQFFRSTSLRVDYLIRQSPVAVEGNLGKQHYALVLPVVFGPVNAIHLLLPVIGISMASSGILTSERVHEIEADEIDPSLGSPGPRTR